MTKHYFGMGKELKALSMLIFVVVFIDMYTDELQIGGIHILVLGLMCMMFKFLVSRQYMYVGMVYAVIVMLYPHMIGLVPLFLLRMRFKAMIVAACALVVLLFLPVIFVGWETLIGYLAEWKMSIVNQHIDLLHEKNTIHYIITEFFFDPFGYEGTESLIAFNVVAVGLGILALAITNIRLKRRYFSLMFFEVFLFLAIIPNMVHGTSGQFILSMPIIWFLLLSCFQKFEGKLIVITVAALIMVPWLFTSTDFVGFKMKALIDESGLLGLANLVFLVLATYVFITRRNMVVKKFSKSSWK
jgi:hypothetical protein